MGNDGPPEPLLEELYRVRDQMHEAVHRLRQASPEQFVATLSSVRTASLGVLQAYTEFVELLSEKTQAADRQDPRLRTAVQQMQDTHDKLEEVTANASRANIEELRRDEAGE